MPTRRTWGVEVSIKLYQALDFPNLSNICPAYVQQMRICIYFINSGHMLDSLGTKSVATFDQILEVQEKDAPPIRDVSTLYSRRSSIFLHVTASL